MADGAPGRRLPTWLPSAAITACVALEMALVASGLDRPTALTALGGVTTLAVGIALAGPMGLRRATLGVRALIGVPLLLAVATTVVLVLDASFRRGAVWP